MEKSRIGIIILFIILFSIAIIISLIYNNGKYTVSFETGTNDVFLTQYVERNKTVDVPSQPKKDGYVFKEWQLDGVKFDFSTPITKNTVLTAKWVKEEYINVKFMTNDKEVISEEKLLKGEAIEKFPIISKNGYEFIGWYLDNELYSNKELYDDAILVANYKKNTNELKVGDRVTIIGSYSSSAYNINAYYDRAIGWNREILYIIEDSNYPYAVGNSYGVTGFFKKESLNMEG